MEKKQKPKRAWLLSTPSIPRAFLLHKPRAKESPLENLVSPDHGRQGIARTIGDISAKSGDWQRGMRKRAAKWRQRTRPKLLKSWAIKLTKAGNKGKTRSATLSDRFNFHQHISDLPFKNFLLTAPLNIFHFTAICIHAHIDGGNPHAIRNELLELRILTF